MFRTDSIWRWQLVFTASIVANVVMVVGFKPQTLAIPLFIGGMGLIVVTTLVAL
ncbi:hypothetical protein [Microbacterium sp. GbtcB4]|uniref:hypothetical protein n=1 Tax=Microbacterium sp. GbtcB4 TaxID=2824749 RepID=UPI001C30C4D6